MNRDELDGKANAGLDGPPETGKRCQEIRECQECDRLAWRWRVGTRSGVGARGEVWTPW
jgi:hypothetical protein